MLVLQTLIDSLMIGGVYAIVAVGLSLGFGVMRIINWAHGELLMLSMFLSYYLVTFTSLNPYIVMIITGIVMFMVGFVLQGTVFNKLLARETKREPTSVLLFTSGLGMVLSNGAQILFGTQAVTAKTQYSGKTIAMGDLIISIPKLVAFIIAIIAALTLFWFLQKTETGRAIRATSQNRQVARLMGVNEKLIYSISFGIGIALVGIAGGMIIPFFAIYPTVGQVFSFKSFVIVVLGGKGSVPGALLGGFLVGFIEKFGALLFNESIAQILLFCLFIAILLFKPTGLLSKEKD